ncbi:MAG: glycosyltransferase family 4 protein [Vicinamibacterales bacterium]
MRILLINDYATPNAGAEVMILLLRNELRRRGHDARVFASRAQLIPGDSFADYTCFGTTTRWQAVSSAFNVSAWWTLRRTLRSFRPDMVHVKMFLWQLSPAIMPLLRNTPSLYHIVTYKPVCPRGSKLLPDGSLCTFRAGVACHSQGCLTAQSWVPMMAQRILFRRWRSVFDAFITNSEAVRQRLVEEGVGPVQVLANGTLRRQQRPPLTGPPVLAYAGRLSAEKGVETLLHAFAGLKGSAQEARLWVAGDGPLSEPLRRVANDLGISARVEFLGSLSREALEARFDAAWAQIIPSLWEEPFGMVAIEAMMRGTAVIASNGGGLREIVRPGAGLLVPAGDVSALTEALRELVNDRTLCERMGDTGRRIALAEYTAESHADSIEAIYGRLIGESSQGPA